MSAAPHAQTRDQPLGRSSACIRNLLDDFPPPMRLSPMPVRVLQPLTEDLPPTTSVSTTPPPNPHLQQGIVVDLLVDRSAASFAKWLQEHPGVRIISRDRDGIYAERGRARAPAAKQVADRFHLTQNLSQAVQDTLAHQRDRLLMPAQVRSQQRSAGGTGAGSRDSRTGGNDNTQAAGER
jgi:hypothetical protein